MMLTTARADRKELSAKKALQKQAGNVAWQLPYIRAGIVLFL